MRACGRANRRPLGSTGEQECAHAGRLTDADGTDRRFDVVHRVIDRHSAGNHAARRVDVDGDFFIGIFTLQVQKLGDDDIRYPVIDGCTEKNDSVF